MNTEVADWIEVDDSRYNLIKSHYSGADPRSVLTEMTLSPYDVPSLVRGDYDDDSKKFVIDFRYIDSEDITDMRLNDHVTAYIGSGSGRIYALLIDTGALGGNSAPWTIMEEAVHKDAENALHKMLLSHTGALFQSGPGTKHRKQKSNSKNYSVVQEIVKDYWGYLKQDLRAAR
ncbi:hypothetical protein I5T86_09560 [Stenotrophomonas maltophilia]|nr:hypothetical protein [Stenotrophomonas maltophilia]MBH1520819.1 hypothetical protein [Stenotrophomonas maltophilia]